jgi:hypothetical protein
MSAVRSVLINDERYYPEALVVDGLAQAYQENPDSRLAVANACDRTLDPTGRLLGLVRRAASPSSTEENGA